LTARRLLEFLNRPAGPGGLRDTEAT